MFLADLLIVAPFPQAPHSGIGVVGAALPRAASGRRRAIAAGGAGLGHAARRGRPGASPCCRPPASGTPDRCGPGGHSRCAAMHQGSAISPGGDACCGRGGAATRWPRGAAAEPSAPGLAPAGSGAGAGRAPSTGRATTPPRCCAKIRAPTATRRGRRAVRPACRLFDAHAASVRDANRPCAAGRAGAIVRSRPNPAAPTRRRRVARPCAGRRPATVRLLAARAAFAAEASLPLLEVPLMRPTPPVGRAALRRAGDAMRRRVGCCPSTSTTARWRRASAAA